MLAPRGAIIGCDYSGTFAKVGRKAPRNWAVGDRVAGSTHGGLYTDRGSFAEYFKFPGDLAWKPPSAVSDSEAATFGVSAVAAIMALDVRLGVPWTDNAPMEAQLDPPKIHIYFGATAAGLFAIQLAKLAGLKVVTTASPCSHDLVKHYGADDVFDYKLPSAIEDIKRAYPNISRAMDCFSEAGSTEFCVGVIQDSGSRVVTLLDSGKTEIDGVKIDFMLGCTAFNEVFQWLPPFGPKFVAKSSAHEALRRFYGSLAQLSVHLKPTPIKSLQLGLESLPESLNLLRKGKVSGTKLVSTLC